MAQIIARPNPFKEGETYVCEVPAGITLATLLPDVHPHVTVAINGDRVAREDWPHVRVQADDLVVIGVEPKDLGLSAIITIIVAAISIASTIYSFLQKPPTIPNPTGLNSDRYANLVGAGNPINKFQPIPKLYGKFRITAPLAANYYTRIDKRRQQLNILLCLGYGPLQIAGVPVGKRLTPKAQVWTDIWGSTAAPLLSAPPFTGSGYTVQEQTAILAARNKLYPALRQVWTAESSTVYYDYHTSHPKEVEEPLPGDLPADTLVFGSTDLKYFSGVQFEIGHPDQISLYAEDSEVDYVNHQFPGPVKMGNAINIEDMIGEGKLLNYVTIGGKQLSEPNNDKTKVRNRDEYYWYTVDNTVSSATDPAPATQGTASNTIKAVLEMDFTALYCSTQKGAIVQAGVWVYVEYRKGDGTFNEVTPNADILRVYDSFDEHNALQNNPAQFKNGNWKDTPARFKNGNWKVIRALNSQLFVSLTIEFKLPAQYTLRVTRKYTYLEDGMLFYTDCVWQELRSVQETNSSTKPWLPAAQGTHGDEVVLMALRLNHSGQLNGNVDAVSVLAQSILQAWNGSAWEEKPTSNPAWAYVDTLTGNATQKTIDLREQIDADRIKDWADWCDNVSGVGPGYLVEYSKYHVEDEPVLDRLRAIATAGYATWSYFDDRFSVAHEFSPAAFLPRQMLTPRNSWNFSFSREFPIVPHAYRVKFIDDTSWEEAEAVVFNTRPGVEDLYTASEATRYEVLNTTGIVGRPQAIRYGRYMFNVMKHRQASYTVDTDMETIHLVRGDCLYLAYDTLKENVKTGRVVEVVTDAESGNIQVKLDETVTLASNYRFYFRNTVTFSPDAAAAPDLFSSSSPLGSYPAGTALRFDATLANKVSAGDLFILGRAEQEVVLAKVVKMTKRPDQTVTLGLVDAASSEALLPLSTVNTTRAAQEKVVKKSLRGSSPAQPQALTLSFSVSDADIKNQGEVTLPVKASWTVPTDKARNASNVEVASRRIETPVAYYLVAWWVSSDPDNIKTATASESHYVFRELVYTSTTATDGTVTYPVLTVRVQSVSPTGNKSPHNQATLSLKPPDSLPLIREATKDQWLDWTYIQNLMVDRLTVDGLVMTQDVYYKPAKYNLPYTFPRSRTSKSVFLTRQLEASELPDSSGKAGFWIQAEVTLHNLNKSADYTVSLYQDGVSTALESVEVKDVKKGSKETVRLDYVLQVTITTQGKQFHVKVTRITPADQNKQDTFTVAYLAGIRRIT